jgi:hypothetical protein
MVQQTRHLVIDVATEVDQRHGVSLQRERLGNGSAFIRARGMLPCSPKPSIEPMTLSRLDALDVGNWR